MMGRSLVSLLCFLSLLTVIEAIKTSIYIDQVPLYSSLAECAQDPLSAIVRAQSSGCGDDQQLTSFSCFCIDQSSMMSSIISTAVQTSCAANATATVTEVLPEVTSALDVFDSYCARSTELVWYKNNATETVTITQAPTSLPVSSTTPSASSSPQKSSKSVPIAAIAAPVVIGVIAIAAVVGVLFWLRRRRTVQREQGTNHFEEVGSGASSDQMKEYPRGELPGDLTPMGEMEGGAEKYRYELENRETTERAELDGAGPAVSKKT